MGVFSLTFLDPFVCCCFSVSLPFLRCDFFPSSCFFSLPVHLLMNFTDTPRAIIDLFLFYLFIFLHCLCQPLWGEVFFSSFSSSRDLVSFVTAFNWRFSVTQTHTHTYKHPYKLFRAFIWTRVEWQQFSNDNNCSAFQNVSQWMAQN